MIFKIITSLRLVGSPAPIGTLAPSWSMYDFSEGAVFPTPRVLLMFLNNFYLCFPGGKLAAL